MKDLFFLSIIQAVYADTNESELFAEAFHDAYGIRKSRTSENVKLMMEEVERLYEEAVKRERNSG